MRGGTSPVVPVERALVYFNPPTPCGVGPPSVRWPSTRYAFQSTHPVRGGTQNMIMRLFDITNFNPPTPCGVGLLAIMVLLVPCPISIHPPRAGWDIGVGVTVFRKLRFQSTHPVRGGTQLKKSKSTRQPFQSTHPVRGGT